MNFSFCNLLSNYLILFSLTFLAPYQALGEIWTAVQPTDSNGTIVSNWNNDTTININEDLIPISTDEGYSHTTHIKVDQSTGQIKGYSGYTKDTAGNITKIANLTSTIAGSEIPALVTNTAGGISYSASVNGPLNTASGSSYATIYIDIEGSFNYEYGAPSFYLGGGVGIEVSNNENPYDYTSYMAYGGYSNMDEDTLLSSQDNIFLEKGLQVSSSGSIAFFPNFEGIDDESDLAGISPQVEFISKDPEDLSLRVSLTIDIQNGDILTFSGDAGGSATHAFLENFFDI